MNTETKAVLGYDIIKRGLSDNERFDALKDDLAYANYSFNRKRAPEVSADRWAKIFCDAEKLEARFQQEQALKGLDRFHEWRGGCDAEY